MSFRTRKASVHLWKTNKDIFDEFWELSDPSIDSKHLYTIKAQKRSDEIGKIIHVTSGVYCNFTKLREYFVCKRKQK